MLKLMIFVIILILGAAWGSGSLPIEAASQREPEAESKGMIYSRQGIIMSLPSPKFFPVPTERVSLAQPFAVVGFKTYPDQHDLECYGLHFADELASRLACLSDRLFQVERLYLHQIMKAQGLRQASLDVEEGAALEKIRQILILKFLK